MSIDLRDAHPCPDCRQCLANAEKCHYCAERDQLRAQLATASNNERHYADRCVGLEAHAADLRGALEDERSPLRLCNPSCQDGSVTRCMCRHCVDGRSNAALARTPAQSLGRLKAEALREADKELGEVYQPWDGDHREGWDHAAKQLRHIADRQEKGDENGR